MRDRRVSGWFDVGWVDLEECSTPHLLLPFLADFFSRRDPGIRLTPLFRGGDRSTGMMHGEVAGQLKQMRSHRYLLVFDGLSRVRSEDRRALLAVIEAFAKGRAGDGAMSEGRHGGNQVRTLGQSCCVLTIEASLMGEDEGVEKRRRNATGRRRISREPRMRLIGC